MKVLRWIGIVLGGLIGVVLLAAVVLYVIGSGRIDKIYTIPAETVVLPTDQASLERGRHLATAIGKCVDCHGNNLGGTIFLDVDAPPLFRAVAPNLTRGQGGVGGQLSDADLARAIRHGVGPDGKPLLVMPSDDFYTMSDADIGALIAYIRSVPPIDSQLPTSEIRPLGRILLAAGQLPAFPAELIDHSKVGQVAPPAGVTPEYGRYLAMNGGCTGCHGPGLSGGAIPGVPPDFPKARNITPTGIGTWSDEDFFRALREGKRPDGTAIDPFMPWMATRQMTDDEIMALLAYLRTVPARPDGQR
jgi:mono/diheme cytochrome c family protein